MTGMDWIALALILAGLGLGVCAAAPRRPGKRPESHAEPRPTPPGGDDTDPPPGDLFTPRVEASPANITAHWRNPGRDR